MGARGGMKNPSVKGGTNGATGSIIVQRVEFIVWNQEV